MRRLPGSEVWADNTVLFGVALWGVHMAMTQGLLSALVADAAPDRLRGTAFGVFNLATGLTLLVASASPRTPPP